MKNKAPLPLMEQLIMILVFALTAALCLKGFATASRLSHRQESISRAVLEVQNTAEILKDSAGNYESAAELCDGIWNNHILRISYDTTWQTVSADSAAVSYVLTVTPKETDIPCLGSAHICMTDSEGTLFEIITAWQIHSPGGDCL